MTTCRQCRVAIEQTPGGREREFCTNACRQKAYRTRSAVRGPGDQRLRDELVTANQRLRAAARELSDPAIARLLWSGGEAAEAILRASRHLPSP